MIDEDLYQQAADELNSDNRRQHIWARACALASDDHDEARFLYTNLRVEELLAERANAGKETSMPDTHEPEAALSLTSLADDSSEVSMAALTDSNGSEDEFFGRANLAQPGDDLPVNQPAADDSGRLDNTAEYLQLEPLSDEAANETPDRSEAEDPDSDLMADYVPEKSYPPDSDLEDTLVEDAAYLRNTPDTLPASPASESSEASQLYENAAFNVASQFHESSRQDFEAFDGNSPDSPSPHTEGADNDPLGNIIPAIDNLNDDDMEDVDMDSTTDLKIRLADVPAPLTDLQGDATIDEDMTAELTAALDDEDLTQANMSVLDAHVDELDEILQDARHQPASTEEPDADMEWLEADDHSDVMKQTLPEPVVYEDDPFTEELSRQADELELADSAERGRDQPRQLVDDLVEEPSFPDLSDSASPALPAAAAAVAAASSATVRDESLSDSYHLSEDGRERSTGSVMDLTEGRKGKAFSIFSLNGEAEAVKNGVSWTALFFTFPYLLYKQLFATAAVYLLLWIITVGGFLVCGLAWLDDGIAAPPIVQAGTIGFALLAFIGLIYLPFRHANSWRREKLEKKGYQLVAIAKARNKHLAIARAIRHAALD